MRQTKKPKPWPKGETEQISLRLPVEMVEQFRQGRGLSAEIQTRLFNSLLQDQTDPHLRVIEGRIEELARRVRRQLSVEWHDDAHAHRAFVVAVTRMLAALPLPAAMASTPKHPPEVIGEIIADQLVAENLENEQTRKGGDHD